MTNTNLILVVGEDVLLSACSDVPHPNSLVSGCGGQVAIVWTKNCRNHPGGMAIQARCHQTSIVSEPEWDKNLLC